MTAAVLDRPQAPTGWAAVRAVSPRPRVRVADVDPATGRIRNLYPDTAAVTRAEPQRPYAVYLADRAGRFRLLAFDLDASRGPVAEDLAQLRGWLHTTGIPHLVARSGPGGGRHVWMAVAGGAGAGQVASLARALAARLPTLDPAPLLNPATGCVRPPGAPHRVSGCSSVLDGDWTALTRPVATDATLDALLTIVGPVSSPGPAAGARYGTGVDTDGHRHLLGPRRALPAKSRTALDAPLTPGADPSAVLWTVLLGAVRARWRYQDVAELLETAPGLEHARTLRVTPGHPGRSARLPGECQAVLTRQWAQAVSYVAACGSDETGGQDPGFTTRLGGVLADVTAVQARADACPGRWARPGGPADRRVLDHACVIALTAVRPVLDLDIRSLAVATGIGRETARTALHRLAADGWLAPAATSTGPHAASWSLPSATPAASPAADHENTPAGSSTGDGSPPRSHVVPPPGRDYVPAATPPLPPSPAGLDAARSAWSHRLRHRLGAQCHDVFTGGPGGLGHHQGALYGALETSGPVTADELALRTGRSPLAVGRALRELHAYRLARPGPGGRSWTAGSRRHRVTAAKTAGVHGVLSARARRVGIERAVWEWWLAELDWMHTPARQRPRRYRRRRRPGPGQLVLPLPVTSVRQRRGAYPRDVTGRGDHRQALVAVTGTGQVSEAA